MTGAAAAAAAEQRTSILSPEAAYDLTAPFYDAWKWQAFWHDTETPFLRGAVESWTGAAARPRLIDVGCGTGWYLDRLGDLCLERAGVDVSGGMLQLARCRLPGVTIAQADARDLPFPDRSFDIVLSTRVLTHVPELEPLITETVRVLGPGGLAILTSIDARHHYQHTRLPVAGGHVVADTYKHTREHVAALLADAGLRHRRSTLIPPSGAPVDIERLEADYPDPVVGWMSVWRL